MINIPLPNIPPELAACLEAGDAETLKTFIQDWTPELLIEFARTLHRGVTVARDDLEREYREVNQAAGGRSPERDALHALHLDTLHQVYAEIDDVLQDLVRAKLPQGEARQARPTQPSLRTATEVQRAHDMLVHLILDEKLFHEIVEDERDRYQARAVLDALCWVLDHGHNQTVGENFTFLEQQLLERGYILTDGGRLFWPEEVEEEVVRAKNGGVQ